MFNFDEEFNDLFKDPADENKISTDTVLPNKIEQITKLESKGKTVNDDLLIFDFEAPVKKEEKPKDVPVKNMLDFEESIIINAKNKAISEVQKEVSCTVITEKQVEMVQWFDEHWYQFGENYYPSVTTILNVYPNKLAGIMQWRGEVGNDEAANQLRSAGEHGSYIHGLMEEYVRNTPLYTKFIPEGEKGVLIKDQRDAIQIYRLSQFFKIVKPKILMSEMKLYSAEHEYGGSTDLLLEIKDGQYMIDGNKPVYLPSGIYVADYKTSNNLHPEYWCQVAAYSKAIEELYPDTKIRGNLILHTKSNNKYGIEGFACKVIMDDSEKNINDYFNDFLTVYACWKINPSPKKPRIFSFPNKIQLGE